MRDVAVDRVVLAPSPLAEALAVDGVTVWVSNPVDAFMPDDQVAYLDFLSGRPGMDRAVAQVDVVVTQDGTAAARAMGAATSFDPVECSAGWTCHVRR